MTKNKRYIPEKFKNDFGDISEWMTKRLWKQSGLYAFLKGDNIIYIGKSTNLMRRIPTSYLERTMQTPIDSIVYFPVSNKTDMNILELILIGQYLPELNVDCNEHEKSELFQNIIDVKNVFYPFPNKVKGDL